MLISAQAQATPSASTLTHGDTAILQFLAAGEALEADFYTQYNELGGMQDSEVPGGYEDVIYTERQREIDPNIPQYIHDVADDEMSHQNFIKCVFSLQWAEPVDMEPFRTLEGSSATGSS